MKSWQKVQFLTYQNFRRLSLLKKKLFGKRLRCSNLGRVLILDHWVYVLKVYRGEGVRSTPPPQNWSTRYPKGGGVHRTPPSISVVYQPISMKFSHHVTYHVSFPKNIGLALYDLYDVINDVINSKNRNFQKLLQITIFDRFWWIRMEIKA